MKPEQARGQLSFSTARLSAALLSTLPFALLGCGAHHGGGGGGYSGPTVFYENEPNGSADHPDFFGGIDGSAHFVIEGHVDAFGPDWLDGFAFVTDEPLTFSFELHANSGFADVDAFLYDPDLDETVAWFDSSWNPEVGSFTILEPGKEFHLVVETYDHDTSYSLEIWGDPAFFSEAADSPEASAAAGMQLPPEARAPRKERRASAVYGPAPTLAPPDEVQVLGHGMVLAFGGGLESLVAIDIILTAEGQAIAVPAGAR